MGVRLRYVFENKGGRHVDDFLSEAPVLYWRLHSTGGTLAGSDGTVRSRIIEIQADHLDRLAPVLASIGYGVKKVGGLRAPLGGQ